MADVTLDRILEDAKSLPPDQQRQLRDRLDEWLRQPSPEEGLEHLLYKAGLLSEIKSPVPDRSHYEDFAPVQVKGQPASETIIEERR